VAEEPLLAAVVMEHLRHPGRAPRGRGLVSLLAAPGVVRDLLDVPDAEVARRLAEPAARYLPGLVAATTATLVHRFRDGLPEATPAALRLRSAFARRGATTVDYAGDWVTLRPSVEGAVRSGYAAAARVLARHPAPLRRAEPA